MANKFGINKISANFNKLKRDLPPIIGNMGQNFFRQSFERGGFTDKTFVPWEKRKHESKKDKAHTRAILVKSGHLRNSVNSSLKRASFSEIIFSVPQKYAAIHNYGGIINHPGGHATLNYRSKGGKLRLSSVRTISQQRKISEIRRAAIGPYQIKMPVRKFIGHSETLLRQIDQKIRDSFHVLNR
jgi:phage gpG-like protein